MGPMFFVKNASLKLNLYDLFTAHTSSNPLENKPNIGFGAQEYVHVHAQNTHRAQVRAFVGLHIENAM